ncbi:two-component system response regulator [Mucilaginibacter sp. RCC_168]|uniref:response regulator n=1 Tax=Mucilaginibacter sp. RCC_168 TaxID=3239221 RepID=UPI0035248155
MRKKILVIEDDPDILELLSYILREEGYEVMGCEDGSACRHLLEILPDLILMDIRLKEPGQNGALICSQLKSHSATRCFPVVLLSAEFNLPALSKACGADGFISKPFDLEVLMEKVREIVGQKS